MKRNYLKRIHLILAFIIINGASYAQYTKLRDFAYDANSSVPFESFVQVGNTLYGTSYQGGTNGRGTIFRIQKDGSVYLKIHDFSGPDGEQPKGSLYYDGTFLYGTTWKGGINNQGTIFKIKPDGTGFTSIFSFGNLTGNYPLASLISDGTFLYGTCSAGGSGQPGTIFKILTDGSGFQLLHDGTYHHVPRCTLVLEGGFLYGTNSIGNKGSVFRIDTDGLGYSEIHVFNGTDGSSPYASLTFDGTYLYGTTQVGGTNNLGTIFKMLPNGNSFSTLVHFDGTTMGSAPSGDLLVENGNIYGMANSGGANGNGNLFKVGTDGSNFSVLKEFENAVSGRSANGGLYSDGSTLFGMTTLGGVNDAGTIFKYCNSNKNVTVSGVTITADATGATYQWYDCGTSQPIPFQTGQSFTATANGTYQVEVTIGGCSGFSTCETITTVGIEENINSKISIAPNPTSGKFFLTSESQKIKSLEIKSVAGELIFSSADFPTMKVTADLNGEPNGVYFVHVKLDDDSIIVKRIIKQ